jgi:ABC-type amino acid transport system permease subunit
MPCSLEINAKFTIIYFSKINIIVLLFVYIVHGFIEKGIWNWKLMVSLNNRLRAWTTCMLINKSTYMTEETKV